MGAGPAWMRRGTQGHVAAPRGPHNAYVARYTYIHLFTIVNKSVFSLPYMGRVITPINRRVL